MRTLKEEEVHGTDYRDLEDVRSRIGEFLEQVYNRQRLHSALRYLTAEEFEQASQAKGSDGLSTKRDENGPKCHQLIAFQRVSTQGCSPLRRGCSSV